MSSTSRISAVRCGDYASAAVDLAIRQAVELVGGLPPAVAAGGTVLVKPNLLSPRAPSEAVTTHPEVVRAVVGLMWQAGAGRVWIGDSCAGDHDDATLWAKTGMTGVAQATGAELKSFSGEVSPRQLGKDRVPVPVWLSEVDALVSLPKLKTHTLTGLTCAMKNTYGLVAGAAKSAYHATHPSPRSMSDFLVRVHAALKPDFFIVDCIDALEGEGPANGRPRRVGLILAGRDAVAVDAVGATMLKGGARQVPMLAAAERWQVGVADLAKIEMLGDGLEALSNTRLKSSLGRYLLRLPESLFKPVTRIIACRPKIDDELCVRCGICADICSQEAIGKLADGRYRVEDARCIMCMCCAESCPRHAILVKSPLDLFRRLRTFAYRFSGAERTEDGRDG